MEKLPGQPNSLIDQVLGGLYHMDRILAIKTEEIPGASELKITFQFPFYSKSILPVQHVSANQIDEAIMEGLFLLIGHAAKNNLLNGISFEDFIGLRYPAIFREKKVKFKKELNDCAKENPMLIFSLGEFTNVKNKFYTITVSFYGFCEGYAKLCLNIPDVIRKSIENTL